MSLSHVGFGSFRQDYEAQAEQLLTLRRSGDDQAISIIHHNHPRMLHPAIPWLPLRRTRAEIRNAPFDIADAQLTIARWYCFRDWLALTEYVEAVTSDHAVQRFEAAAEAIITGDLTSLRSLIQTRPELIAARSTRVTKFDPPVHRATLLHYIAANGVEQHRQKSPANAVEVGRALLKAGAEADALADMYGSQCTTMNMLVSSSPPAAAGVQIALTHALADFGADVHTPLLTALAHGFPDAAEALVRRGARIDSLECAAGLGLLDEVERMLPTTATDGRHRALSLAAQHGHSEIVGALLDAGEDPNRYNPKGAHPHSTPLHQAALAGHEAVVRLLVERGARLDIKDKIYGGTPRGWALHAGNTWLALLLVEQRFGQAGPIR